jgi:hypothetical protein
MAVMVVVVEVTGVMIITVASQALIHVMRHFILYIALLLIWEKCGPY